jgi:hypothetical protein
MQDELVDRQQRCASVEDTHHELFAELCRHRRDAEVDTAVVDLDRDASILGRRRSEISSRERIFSREARGN